MPIQLTRIFSLCLTLVSLSFASQVMALSISSGSLEDIYDESTEVLLVEFRGNSRHNTKSSSSNLRKQFTVKKVWKSSRRAKIGQKVFVCNGFQNENEPYFFKPEVGVSYVLFLKIHKNCISEFVGHLSVVMVPEGASSEVATQYFYYEPPLQKSEIFFEKLSMLSNRQPAKNQ